MHPGEMHIYVIVLAHCAHHLPRGCSTYGLPALRKKRFGRRPAESPPPVVCRGFGGLPHAHDVHALRQQQSNKGRRQVACQPPEERNIGNLKGNNGRNESQRRHPLRRQPLPAQTLPGDLAAALPKFTGVMQFTPANDAVAPLQPTSKK